MSWRNMQKYAADYNANYEPDNGQIDTAYEVAEVSEDNGGWAKYPGWASSFRIADRLPDPMRLGREEVLQQPTVNQDRFYRKVDADEKARESVVTLNATLKDEPVGAYSGKQVENSPYRKGWPEPKRLTMRKSPNSWFFWRPFDTDKVAKVGARELNGDHFSMADHRRTYPIMGMEPVHRGRNTYRIEPPPWDEELVDGPTNSPGYQVPINYETRTDGSRSYRL